MRKAMSPYAVLVINMIILCSKQNSFYAPPINFGEPACLWVLKALIIELIMWREQGKVGEAENI